MKHLVRFPIFLHRATPVALLLLGTALSFLALREGQIADTERVETALALQAEWRVGDFQAKVKDAAVTGESLAVFFATQKLVDTNEFHLFAQHALRGRPTTSLAWAPWVSDDDRADFERRASAQNALPSYKIFEMDKTGAVVPADARPYHAPVLFEERFRSQNSILGYDYLSNPTRRTAVQQARDSGGGMASAADAPIFSTSARPVLNFFWPVYRPDASLATVGDRRTAFVGMVVAGARSSELMEFGLSDTPPPNETSSLFLGPQSFGPNAAPLALYNYDTRAVEIGSKPLGQPVPGGLRLLRNFDAIGQRWVLVFDFPPAVLADLRSSTDLGYLLVGLLITIAISGYLAAEQRRRQAVEGIVAMRTRELRQAGDQLRKTSDQLRETSDQLRETGDQLKAMIDASPDAIVCLDSRQHVILWNRSAVQLFGYPAAEVIGQPYPLVLPHEREEFERRIGRLAKGEILRNLDSHRPRKDGTILETSSSAAAFYDPTGALQGIIFLIKDSTQRNQIQAQLRQAQKMEAVGQLTGGLAHDFNNLLGIVLGNLDFLVDRFDTGSEERELTDAAMKAATRGAELTRQLLAFSRLQPLAPKRIDPVLVLEGIAHLLRRTLGENVRLSVTIDQALWPLLIDVSQLESSILNLAVNARDAMPNGGSLTIEATNVLLDELAPERNAEAAPGDYVVVAVSDTGSGMAPDVLAHVFEPFFTTKGTKGTGLGLSMVHGFVKQSGGHTRIYSEIGRGTTIRIYLPRAEPPDVENAPSVDSTPPASGNEVILVVEDNPGMRDISVRQLQSLGYRTLPASDGEQALEMLRGGVPVDLLFTDVVMPGTLDGKALALAARRLRPDLRILFTSGFTAAAAATVMNDDFGSFLLSKPYRKEELARRVRAVLDNSETWSG